MVKAKLIYEDGFPCVELTEGEVITKRIIHCPCNSSLFFFKVMDREFMYDFFPPSEPTLYGLVQIPLEIA